MTVVNPDLWLESLEATLKEYVAGGLAANVYDFRMDFPAADFISDIMPLEKTLIHFDIDDMNNPLLGLGTGAEIDATFDVPNATMDITEAFQHDVNFDVGVWASDQSGGVTARYRAYRRLCDLFTGKRTLAALKETQGIEVLNNGIQGGVFATEKIQDVRVFRVMGINLDVRVFSRKIYQDVPYVETTVQDPELETLDGPITG